MTTTALWTSGNPMQAVRPRTMDRDSSIDTMRGIAILMVIGIHSLQQPLDTTWSTLVDAALRPCVPVFLFVSGLMTARSGRVILWKRISAALIPYVIAFVAAFVYMSLHNPAMDHRITTTVARFILAYVFVYYYVFVYIGCTAVLWLIFQLARPDTDHGRRRLVAFLIFAIAAGLIVGSYLDPLLVHSGFSASIVQEVRLRDIPFWFGFVALGALIGLFGAEPLLRNMRLPIIALALAAYAVYAGVRLFGIGDAADYDSTAFFGYAALVCIALLIFHPDVPFLTTIGSGSYFIYLWHIFIVMSLRDHSSLRELGAVTGSAITYVVTAVVSTLAVITVRQIAPPRLSRWLGA